MKELVETLAAWRAEGAQVGRAVVVRAVAGRLLASLGTHADVPFCAQLDVSSTVPILGPGLPLMVEPFVAAQP